MTLTTLFLDIDGVFTMLDAVELPMERVGGIHVRPIPMANALLKAINETEGIVPVWLTSWDTGAHLWNDRSGTRHWPVAYHLDKKQEEVAKIGWPEFFERDTDRKLIAAAYWLWSSLSEQHRVVWVEDGFAQETVKWARHRSNIEMHETVLVDTLMAPIRTQLLAQHDNPEQAAREFVETHFLRTASEV
jgi:hypothetical protein